MAMLGAGGLGWGSIHIKGGIEVNIIAEGWPAKLQVQHLHRSWAIGRDGLVNQDHSGSPEGQKPLKHQRWLSSRGLEPTPGLEPSCKEAQISTEKTTWLSPSHSGSLEDMKGSKQKLTQNPNVQLKGLLFT